MKKVTWLIGVILVLILLVLAGFFFLQGGGYQTLNLRGYVMQVPRSWQVETLENRMIFSGKNVEKGSFQLLYEETDLASIPEMTGFSGVNASVRESDQYEVKVYELSFAVGGQNVVQYVFCDLPAGPPYQAVLTLTDSDEHEARRILASVEMPSLGQFMPEKPMQKPEDRKSTRLNSSHC